MTWDFKSDDVYTLAVILGATLAYCLAHYVSRADNLERFFPKHDLPSRQANAYFSSQIARGFILGGAGIIYSLYANISLDFSSFDFVPFLKSIGWAIGVMLVFLPFIWSSAKKPEIQKFYPELRVAPRDKHLILNSATGWFVFLLGYEIIFRGLLLHYGVKTWGLWPGIAVMTALYVLAHLHKPASETFACFLVGPLFAYFTLETGTVWTVVFLHAMIAITNENIAAKYNPEFHPEVAS